MYYLLFYNVVADYVTRRIPLREEHLVYSRQAVAQGELVLRGAFAKPVDGALRLFRGEFPNVAENFAKNDPYVIHGLVTAWKVREWTTVVGVDQLISPENQLPNI